MIDETLLIAPDVSLKEALKKLDISALGVLLVADSKQKLLGTITDGDIRRAMLAGYELSEPIRGHFNENPHFFYENRYSADEARKLFLERRFEIIPILSKDGTISSYLTWSTFFAEEEIAQKTKRTINVPLVVMAGGKGTRMAPFTKVLPKPLIPIGDKTILELILDEFRGFGVEDIYFTLNYRGEMIRAYFDGIDRPYSVHYLWEKEFCGTAGSLRLLMPEIPEVFFVSNCDIIVNADFADVYDFHMRNDACLTVISSVKHTKIPYGVVRFGAGGLVERIEEKPEFSFTINTGVYLLSRKCVDFIPEGKVFHMTDLMQALMDAGQAVYTYPVNENEYTDIGQWDEYQRAIGKFRE